MICDPDEFLLLMQKWATDSARVVLTLLILGDSKQSAFAVRAEGRVEVDAAAKCLRVRDIGKDGFVIVDVAQWPSIGYADKMALPKFEAIEEAFTLNRPGAALSLWRMLER